MTYVPMDIIWAVFNSAVYAVMAFILPIALTAAGLAGLVSAVATRSRVKSSVAMLTTFSVAFASLVVGYLAGASRETVSGDILPVVMSGFGALASYSVIKGTIPITVACGLSILIAAGLLSGTLLGAAFREFGPANFQAVQPPPDFSGEVQG